MDLCFSKSKDPEQPHPGVVKLVEKLTANIAYISGISTVTRDSKDDLQKNQFWELCHSAIGTKNYTYLKTILLSFIQKLKELSITCYHKPNRATKLMKFMNQAMVFFHLQFQDMKETIESFDCSSYYSTITDLIALYLDMELHASRRRREHLEKISGRLTSFLVILLDNSQEHILDALLKSKFSKNFHEICNAVLKKFLNSDISTSIDVNMYIRYILAYKLWKKIMKTIDERKQITKIAVGKLFWPPNLQRSANVFGSVLPKIPKSKKDPTLFFIQAKFKIKSAYEAFIKSSNNCEELESEITNCLETTNNFLKTKKKTFKPLSKKHKDMPNLYENKNKGKANLEDGVAEDMNRDIVILSHLKVQKVTENNRKVCKDTEKCNYKGKLRKKKCGRIQKKKLHKNTNSLGAINKTDVPVVITINDAGSGVIDEIKLADEFSLKSSIIGNEDIRAQTFLPVSSQRNLTQEEKTDEPQSMEVDITCSDLIPNDLNLVQENNCDESQSMQVSTVVRRDSVFNKAKKVQGKESIHADIEVKTDLLCIKQNRVQGKKSDELQSILLDIAVRTDSMAKKSNEVQADESDKPQNIHIDIAAWSKSVFNEPYKVQEENNDEHQSMQMDIATKNSKPNELNRSMQQDMVARRESFNFTVSSPVDNRPLDHKTANEYSSVDSPDFKMIIPKNEKINTEWIKEATNYETKFIPNLVPFLPKCDTKGINSNYEVKQEVLDSDNITVKEETDDDIQMEADPENQITLYNGKLVSEPIDSNDNYGSETSTNQNFIDKSPFQLMKNLSDPFIIGSQELLEERPNLELTLAPRELLEYDFVSLDNIERTESVDNFNNSSLNQFSNYVIDDCEEIFSSINNNNTEENDSVTFEMKQKVEHCQDISGVKENSLIVVKCLDDTKDGYKIKSKNAETYSGHQIPGRQNETEDSEEKEMLSNEGIFDKTESEYRKMGALEESSESSNIICINNEKTDEKTTIIIIQGRMYSDINPGSPSDTHFVTVGEYDIFNDQVEGQGDKFLGNEEICSEKINLHLNEDNFSKSNYYSNCEIDPQNERNSCVLDQTESNLKSKCQIQRTSMKDYPMQVTSDKLTHLQDNIEIEKETGTALEIPEALILETCEIGETVSTEINDNSINTIAFIRSPTSIDMLIPRSLTTQNINNTCNSESIQLFETFDNTENEYQQCESDQERERTSQLTESQILSLKEFLIIKEKDLGGNFHELSNVENDIIEEQELEKNDTLIDSKSIEVSDRGSGDENSNFLDSIQFICHKVPNISSNVPLEANDPETSNSGCKTEEPNVRTRQMEINCDSTPVASNVSEPDTSCTNQKSNHHINCDSTPVASNVSEPDNSCKRLEDIKNQKSKQVIHFDALLSNSCTKELDNINWTDRQLLNFDEEGHPNVNISQVDVSNDLLEGSKSSKSNYELDFGHVASNRFKGVRLPRNTDTMMAPNQNLKIMDSIQDSDIESSRVNVNNTMSTPDLSEAGMLFCRLEHPKTSPGLQEQNLTENTKLDMNILNKKTTNCKRTECSNQNVSEQKQSTPLQEIISKTGDGIYDPKVSKIFNKKILLKIKSRAYLSKSDLSYESDQTVVDKEHSNLQDTALSTINSSKCLVDSSNDNVLVSNEVSLTDKSSSETENSKHRAEDSNPSAKDILEHVSSDVRDVIENLSCSKHSNNENKIVSNDMRQTDKNGPTTENSWYRAQDSTSPNKYLLGEITPDVSGAVANWISKRLQHFSEKTTAVTKKSKSDSLGCEDEPKQWPSQPDIAQAEAVNCSVSNISYSQVDNNESCANNIQTIDKDSARKRNKRKDTEQLNSSKDNTHPVNFYLTPIMNGFSYSVGSEIKYTPLLQPPQAPETLTANLQLICKCASCYAHYLKQSEKNQTHDSAKHPFIPDRNYIYIDGELVENEVMTVMKKLEWFLMHVMSDRKEPEDLEYKYKQDSESPNLPIKKRLTLAHMISSRDENKIEEECFPSYSKKRMMSIAELEVTQNPSYYRPLPFQLYDSHLNPNGPIDGRARSGNLHLQSKFSNYNSTMVFNNSPFEYMPLDTVQQYVPYSEQQHTLQCSVASEAVSSKYGHSTDTDKRYSLDRALEEVNKTIIYSKGMNAKSTNNYYEIRYKYNNYFQER